ncbi:glycosyltransferase family 4 protein [Parabacteroides distasonis]|nr:glycosyltransferase family 4 protein [Parabacteroides distasonis]
MLHYVLIFLLLLVAEVGYFRIADRCNIIDRPNERSSHSSIVLRGGGIIFMLGLWIWAAFFGLGYTWFLVAVTLIAGVSFVDDIRSLPDSVRLVAQFVAMGLMFYQLDMLHWEMWWVVILALIVSVGASNIINFMDGINGITGGYALASLIPIYVLNKGMGFVEESLVVTVILADAVFCLFNFRPKGKAKCFAGDVGSIGIAFILLFLIGQLVMKTGDMTYLIFLLVYGVDGCLTIIHRIMLHENLGEAHRKHAYQLMANELKIGHVKVSLLYMCLQLVISLGFVFIVPNTLVAHWLFLFATILVLAVAYLLFMKKNYHLHQAYLDEIKRLKN